MKYLKVSLLAFSSLLGGSYAMAEVINFNELSDVGLMTRDIEGAEPEFGVIESYDLEFPSFQKGVINKAPISGWVAGYLTGPSVFADFKEFQGLSYDSIGIESLKYAFDLGYYLLLKTDDNRYLCVLPIVSKDVMSFISPYEGKPSVKVATWGTDAYTGKAPLFAWAFAEDPYTATRLCWEQALESEFVKGNVQWRSEKTYPELFDYLGWCTWEAFGGGINESIVTDAITTIKEGPVPIRWIIVDDGYLDNDEETYKHAQIYSFGVNDKFPNGWAPITSLKDEESVKWIGIWRNMSGGMFGVSPKHSMTELEDHLIQKETIFAERKEETLDETDGKFESMIIKPGAEASQAFYDAMADHGDVNGFDFHKVDFQTFNAFMHSQTGNGVLKAHENNQALEEASLSNGMPILNCISQSSINVFNTKHSLVTRASVDIKLDNDNMGRTRQSFANNLWWGEILVGDLDMYHTSNDKTAQYLTVARAVSGGPIYISDEPHHFDQSVIDPVIYSDGQILRALTPAVPLPDSIFSYGNQAPYRVIAPTKHQTCSIAAFNFSKDKATQSGVIRKEDYAFAGAKTQPYEGLWNQPEEGLVVFEEIAQKGAVLDADYAFEVDRMRGKIFTLAPISKGWAVIGLADKYLSGVTYDVDAWSEGSVKLTLHESGPFVVYHREGSVVASEGEVTEMGDGFFKIVLPKTAEAKQIELSLK